MKAAVGTISPSPSNELRAYVERESEQKVLRCYQCGKCNGGCLAYYVMDMGPRRIMRSIQLGLKEEVLSSSTIWLCIFCQTCTDRCPAQIDIARVMDRSAGWLQPRKAKQQKKTSNSFIVSFSASSSALGVSKS